MGCQESVSTFELLETSDWEAPDWEASDFELSACCFSAGDVSSGSVFSIRLMNNGWSILKMRWTRFFQMSACITAAIWPRIPHCFWRARCLWSQIFRSLLRWLSQSRTPFWFRKFYNSKLIAPGFAPKLPNQLDSFKTSVSIQVLNRVHLMEPLSIKVHPIGPAG